MKNILRVAAILIASISIISCNKDNSSSNKLLGNWSITRIETVSLSDGSVLETFTEKDSYGSIITDYENPVLLGPLTPMGANWPNGVLVFEETTVSTCLLPYQYKVVDNVIIPSSEWKATIVQLTNNSLILYAENTYSAYGAKFYYRK